MAQILGKRNIRANSVCPGVTMSPATKAVVPAPIIGALADAVLGTTLSPSMTGVVMFLASDETRDDGQV
jgi:NAD(P)-dependent dehydrogenase (short-subunit alcohol dehydrogenase family)